MELNWGVKKVYIMWRLRKFVGERCILNKLDLV